MSRTNFKEQQPYWVQFRDHCVGIKGTMLCEVVGFVVEDTEEHVTLTHWRTITDDEEIKSENYEYTTILKGVIKKKRKLKI